MGSLSSAPKAIHRGSFRFGDFCWSGIGCRLKESDAKGYRPRLQGLALERHLSASGNLFFRIQAYSESIGLGWQSNSLETAQLEEGKPQGEIFCVSRFIAMKESARLRENHTTRACRNFGFDGLLSQGL